MGTLRKSGRIVESDALPDPIPSSNLQHWFEQYINHLGTVDNFTETAVTGTATATADAANHEMDLVSGVNDVSLAYYRMKKTWTASAYPLVGTLIINNPATPTANIQSWIGFRDNFTSAASNASHAAFFYNNNNWQARTHDASGGLGQITNLATPLADGDILTIVITTNKTLFYQNGVVVAAHVANVPTLAMYFGANVNTTVINQGVSGTVSVDFIGLVRYFA